MSTENVNVTMQPAEMVKIIMKRVKEFYSQDSVKELQESYYNKIFEEVEQELLQERACLKNETEVQKTKKLLMDYYSLKELDISIRSKTKAFDLLLKKREELSDKEIENTMNYLLSNEHLMDEVNDTVEDRLSRNTLKEIVKLCLVAKNN